MARTSESSDLLREGTTCWKRAHAARVAFLIDAEDYFETLAAALENARENVWMLGWDFHSEVRLRRESGSDGDSTEPLDTLLERVVRRRPALHVRVLGWDFAMLYAFERQFLPLLQFGATTHRRIQFAMDSAHPVAASQHQKVVVVDDAMAFVGGLDLTSCRWDTRAHLAGDPRRMTPDGSPYAPFHDVQIAVDGDAARRLGELARDRWRRATGHDVRGTQESHDPWPQSLAPDVENVEVGLSRTQPTTGRQPEVREVEALYRESIAAARDSIYVENQYLTSARVGEWLAERLAEAEGPDVVIVTPRENSGWLERTTMGALRNRVVDQLRAADQHDRLRVFYPHVEELPADQMVNVHAKVMVVDDDFVRVGSSNLSNRSLGLDSECDVSFEAGADEDARRAIARFRNDLLAEHLGVSVERVEETIVEQGSLVRAVDALRGGPRSLEPLDVESTEWTASAIETLGTVDPEHPIPLEDLLAHLDEGQRTFSRRERLRRLAPFVGVLVAAIVLSFAFRALSLDEWLTSGQLSTRLDFFRESWLGWCIATIAFTLACLGFVPVMAATAAAGLAFEPEMGIPVAWVGACSAATIGHVIGRQLWRDTVRRLAGDRLNAISRRLARRGVVASALLQAIPIAPFMVGNLVAGASQVRRRDFVIGTALGIAPGTVLLVLAADQARGLLGSPYVGTYMVGTLAGLALVGIVVAVRRLWSESRARSDERRAR